MPLRRLLVGCAIVAACSAHAADRDLMSRGPSSAPPIAHWTSLAADPPATPVDIGDQAPAFSYLGPDGEWNDANDLFSRGSVLLVFGASEEDMRALERARSVFVDLGVNPALVVDMRAGAAARLAQRLRLTSPIIRDPVRAIAELYGSLDPASLHHAPAYFLVDESRKVRLIGRGAIPDPARILETSAKALGRPLPSSTGLPKS